jgi:tetratricopeptide (TPR) repeat protein
VVSLYREEKPMPVEQLQFQKAVQKVVEILLGYPDELITDLRKFANVLKSVPSLQFVVGFEPGASLLFEAEEYLLAVNLWDRINIRTTAKYQQARAMIATDKKEKVYWLTQSKDNEKVTSLYETTEKSEFDKDSLRLIADAYRATGKMQEALKITWQTGDYVNALDIFEKLLNHIPNDEASAIFSEYYHALLSNSQMDIAYDWYKAIEKQLSPEQRVDYGKSYAGKLLQANRWGEAVQLTKSGGKSKRVLKVAGKSAADVNKLIITEMARSEKIYDATISEKNEIVKYLNDIRIAGFQEWAAWLPLEVMGAALEKTATMIDALGFYESLDREELFPEQKLFVRQRWAKVKSKQVERFHADIGKAANEKDRDKAARSWNGRKRELEEKLSDWRIEIKSIENLPEYPAIKVDEDEEFARKLQVDWQSPACRIVLGSEMLIMIDLKSGSLIPFPPDVVRYKTQKGKTNFHSDKLPISGEIVVGKSLKIFVNGKLQHDFNLETN